MNPYHSITRIVCGILCFCVLPSLFTRAFAQAPLQQPPGPPFVSEPTKSSRWEIVIADVAAAATRPVPAMKELSSVTDSAAPRKVQSWKDASGNVRVIVEFRSGGTGEGFLMGDRFAIRTTADPNRAQVVATPSGNDAILSFFTKDFPGTQWIEARCFTGTEETPEGLCHVFHRPAQPLPEFVDGHPPAGFDPLRHVDLRAWIRAEDKRPTRVVIGPREMIFSKPEPWAGSITFPPVFQAAAEDFQRQVRTLDALRRDRK